MKRTTYRDEMSTTYLGTPKTTYLYRVRSTGELVGVDMCAGEKLDREMPGGFIVLPDGQEGVRAFSEELAKDGLSTEKPRPIQQQAIWPLKSENGGVNPCQREELEAFWQERGITGCRVDEEGDIWYDSRQARKQDHLARGLFDKSGGYGDAMPQNL